MKIKFTVRNWKSLLIFLFFKFFHVLLAHAQPPCTGCGTNICGPAVTNALDIETYYMGPLANSVVQVDWAVTSGTILDNQFSGQCAYISVEWGCNGPGEVSALVTFIDKGKCCNVFSAKSTITIHGGRLPCKTNYELTELRCPGPNYVEYNAKNTIILKDNFVVPSNYGVILKAGESIDLLPGFQTEPESNLFAFIKTCQSERLSNFNDTIKKDTVVEVFHKIQATDKSIYNIIPNPNTGRFTIQIPVKGGYTTELTIYNPLGELVQKSKLTSTMSEIDISSHPQGIYYVQIQQGEEITVKKVVYN